MPSPRATDGASTSPPAYARIAATLRDEIRGTMEPGDVLPSEHALASRFGVNRHTVRRGVDELVQDGLLARQRGRGTVVLSSPIDFPITMDRRFSHLVREIGHESSNHILSKKVVGAPAEVASALGIPEGSEVVFLEQLRLMEATPLAMSRHWLPMPRFRAVLDGFKDGSLHTFIEEQLGISIQLRYAVARAQFPAPDDALNLRLAPKTPTMSAKMTDVDAESGEPVEFAEIVFRGDAMQIILTPGPTASLEAQPIAPA